MAKTKTLYSCGKCGHTSAKWLGKCPACNEFNTYTEETIEPERSKKGAEYRRFEEAKLSPLADVKITAEERLVTGISEADRVFGGGIVKGSLALLGGEPGAGKSTLALMIADKIASQGKKALYISGEESETQIKLRADRIGAAGSKNLLLLIETGIEKITAIIEKEQPALVVVDSIQTVYKEDIDAVAGSVSQVKESCAHLLYTAKRTGIPVIIIGHVTKDGMIAGPKMLEHMVDAVMYFESEEYYRFKILRAVKNRFGSTNEIGVFEMTGAGLREINSPSKMLLDSVDADKPGSAIVTAMEGTRPLLLEVQALTSRRNFGAAQRTVTGVDYNRALLTIAIIEKKLNIHMENQDVFISVAGGIRVMETGADLGCAAAIYSSFMNIPVSAKMAFIGELGLDGSVRPVMSLDQRVAEAERLGFSACVVPEKAGSLKTKLEIIKIKNILELKNILK